MLFSSSAFFTDMCITCGFCYSLHGTTTGFDRWVSCFVWSGQCDRHRFRTKRILSQLLSYLINLGIILWYVGP